MWVYSLLTHSLFCSFCVLCNQANVACSTSVQFSPFEAGGSRTSQQNRKSIDRLLDVLEAWDFIVKILLWRLDLRGGIFENPCQDIGKVQGAMGLGDSHINTVYICICMYEAIHICDQGLTRLNKPCWHDSISFCQGVCATAAQVESWCMWRCAAAQTDSSRIQVSTSNTCTGWFISAPRGHPDSPSRHLGSAMREPSHKVLSWCTSCRHVGTQCRRRPVMAGCSVCLFLVITS